MDIFKTINAVMTDIGAVGKNGTNPKQGYKFRGIDDVMNAINPAMIKHKLFTVPNVIEKSYEERRSQDNKALIFCRLVVEYKFYAEDGSSISCTVVGEGMDSSDKASNKAMSAAYKYALLQTFCIPTEEMIDSEVDDFEPQPTREANAKVPVDNKVELCSTAQCNYIQKMLNEKNIPQDVIAQVMHDYGKDDFKKLSKKEASEVINWLKKND